MRNKNLSGNLFTKQTLTIKETALSSSIAEWLDVHHIYNDRLNSGKIRSGNRMIHLCKPGTPDRFAIVEGQIIFIEVKQKGKTATTEQLKRHEELRNSGAIVIVADSFEEFGRSLEKRGTVFPSRKKLWQ
jgi:hypothetical protein